jgi:hypothetical protein
MSQILREANPYSENSLTYKFTLSVLRMTSLLLTPIPVTHQDYFIGLIGNLYLLAEGNRLKGGTLCL